MIKNILLEYNIFQEEIGYNVGTEYKNNLVETYLKEKY